MEEKAQVSNPRYQSLSSSESVQFMLWYLLFCFGQPRGVGVCKKARNKEKGREYFWLFLGGVQGVLSCAVLHIVAYVETLMLVLQHLQKVYDEYN